MIVRGLRLRLISKAGQLFAFRGFTLVELLVVLAIISLLLQLLLPAIQAAREASRRAQCANNLRQLGIAAQTHEAAQGHLPTGGWTHTWVGDPERGFGNRQPGGWSFTLLPYLEQGNVFGMMRGKSDVAKRQAGAEMVTVPIALMNCPSRRPANVYPFVRASSFVNINEPFGCGRSDYAANIGDGIPSDQRAAGPKDFQEADLWITGKDPTQAWVATDHNGVISQLSQFRFAEVTDGTSNTYLFAEKFMHPGHYDTGESYGDDQSLYVGFDRDNARSTHPDHPPLQDKPVPLVWLRDSDDETVTDWNFGSAHAAGFNAAFCDGSLRNISYDIDPEAHRALGNRQDGRIIP